MKTFIISWIAVLLLFSATTVVTAAEVQAADYIEVWTGLSEGNMCVMVQDTIDKTAATAELWLVTQNEVEWIRDLEGHSCIDVDVGEESKLHILTYDPRIAISVVEDEIEPTVLSQL